MAAISRPLLKRSPFPPFFSPDIPPRQWETSKRNVSEKRGTRVFPVTKVRLSDFVICIVVMTDECQHGPIFFSFSRVRDFFLRKMWSIGWRFERFPRGAAVAWKRGSSTFFTAKLLIKFRISSIILYITRTKIQNNSSKFVLRLENVIEKQSCWSNINLLNFCSQTGLPQLASAIQGNTVSFFTSRRFLIQGRILFRIRWATSFVAMNGAGKINGRPFPRKAIDLTYLSKQ